MIMSCLIDRSVESATISSPPTRNHRTFQQYVGLGFADAGMRSFTIYAKASIQQRCISCSKSSTNGPWGYCGKPFSLNTMHCNLLSSRRLETLLSGGCRYSTDAEVISLGVISFRSTCGIVPTSCSVQSIHNTAPCENYSLFWMRMDPNLFICRFL